VPHTRKANQTVEAFSLPRELLKAAKVRAAELQMSKSGYFRFCLAKELGIPEGEAKALAAHSSVRNLKEQVSEHTTSEELQPQLNDSRPAENKLASNKASLIRGLVSVVGGRNERDSGDSSQVTSASEPSAAIPVPIERKRPRRPNTRQRSIRSKFSPVPDPKE